jgi:tripartite-type tricarboxylate transporter receptor subunit TctC
MEIQNWRWKILSRLGLAFPFLLASHDAQSQADFYKGKNITFIQATEPGGTGDLRARALISSLQKHIPGNPAIISEYMPGGGGRKAANHMYRVARPDGLTFAWVSVGAINSAVLREPGVQYDIDKFTYLGSTHSRTSYTFKTRKEAGFDTLEKLRTASGVRIGGQSVGHPVYVAGRLFAWILSLKEPKFITGYSGTALDLALIQGEIDARANVPDTVLERNPEWIKEGLVHFHAVMEIPKGFRTRHPAFDSLPSLESLTRTDTQRKVLGMFRNFRVLGSPYILPPGTPKDRVEVLKTAFRKAFSEPEFLKQYKKLTGADASPLLPEEQAKAIQETPRDPETIENFKKIAGGDALPPP